jgi:hypothetical protein
MYLHRVISLYFGLTQLDIPFEMDKMHFCKTTIQGKLTD